MSLPMPILINSNQRVEINAPKGNTYGLFLGVKGCLFIGCSATFLVLREILGFSQL